jgi:small nuclear ribonucleoprotein D3
MNVQMENINVTQRDGRVTHLDRVYIRGSHVRLFIVPDMLRYARRGSATGIRNNR